MISFICAVHTADNSPAWCLAVLTAWQNNRVSTEYLCKSSDIHQRRPLFFFVVPGKLQSNRKINTRKPELRTRSGCSAVQTKCANRRGKEVNSECNGGTDVWSEHWHMNRLFNIKIKCAMCELAACQRSLRTHRDQHIRATTNCCSPYSVL